jgi:hypothetical protein
MKKVRMGRQCFLVCSEERSSFVSGSHYLGERTKKVVVLGYSFGNLQRMGTSQVEGAC